MDKEKIEKLMKNLDITKEEAIQLIKDDEEIDRMTSSKQWDSDLTEEQKKVIKDTKKTGRKISETPTKREKKVDDLKKEICYNLRTCLIENHEATDFEIINEEREFTFFVNGEKYKVVLSKPRK